MPCAAKPPPGPAVSDIGIVTGLPGNPMVRDRLGGTADTPASARSVSRESESATAVTATTKIRGAACATWHLEIAGYCDAARDGEQIVSRFRIDDDPRRICIECLGCVDMVPPTKAV